MLNKKVIPVLISLWVIVFVGCAGRTLMPLSDVRVPSEVVLETTDGRSFSGILEARQDSQVVLKTGTGQQQTFAAEDVKRIYVLPSEYDESGNIITREEIAAEKNSKNTVLYTVGGAALSFGGSLFLSSLIYRASDAEFKVANPISIGGGILGTVWLHFQGKKRDRVLALERIKDRRKQLAEQELLKKQQEKEKLLEEKKKLEEEKARIEAEKKRLQEELKKKKKKKKSDLN